MGMFDSNEEVTKLLNSLTSAGKEEEEGLFLAIYKKLHSLAHWEARHMRNRSFFQTTELAHETYLSLMKNKHSEWCNRAHFYAVAAKAMRRIVIGELRRKRSLKRGGGKEPLNLDAIRGIEPAAPDEGFSIEKLEEIEHALDLMEKDPRKKVSSAESVGRITLREFPQSVI